jgi:cytochrome c-type biogenesis protein CcmF
VGGPFFDTMTMPIVLCLLFLMAVAPVLPWRRASGELLRQRLLWPAAGAAGVLAGCVLAGLRGFWPLLVFTLAAFAGTSALRQLVLLVRRAGPRSIAGRSGGGMIVHLGVVLVAVGFAASHAYQHQTLLTMSVGRPASFEGHTLVFRGTKMVTSAGRSSLVATIDVDGHAYYPAIEQFALSDQSVVSPAVHSTPAQDIYLALTSVPTAADPDAGVAVYVTPLVMWLWVGGLVVVLGALLSLWPSGRPRAGPAEERSRGHAGDAHVSYGTVDGAEQETIDLPEPGKTGVGAAV